MVNSFDIQDADTINTLILICKVTLKANQALDSGDYDGFGKLSRTLEQMRKSAKFTAAQKKEEKADDRAKANAAKSEAKNKEKELKDKYGSSYTQQTKLEQDRFKMQSATASATEETAKNTKSTKLKNIKKIH